MVYVAAVGQEDVGGHAQEARGIGDALAAQLPPAVAAGPVTVDALTSDLYSGVSEALPVGAGWLPPGFAPVGAWVRKLPSVTERGEQREVLQLLYSDGLAGLSIFVEPWSAERSARPLQLGAVNMLGKRVGRFWLTIVGEVPMATVRRVADSIEFAETSPR